MAQTKTANISSLIFKFLSEKDRYTFLAKLRVSIPQSQYGVFADEILKYPAALNKIAAFKDKPTYADLQEFKTLSPIDIYSELSWMKAFLIRTVSKLQEFINLSKDFSKAIVCADYSKATNLLEQIEERYGCSIWLIKNKMALLQISQGLQSQKSYADLIKKEVNHTGTIAYLTYWISLRNEESVTANRFEYQFEQNYKDWNHKTQDDLGTYIRFHLLGDESCEVEDAISLPRIDFSRSLIDFYESFLTFCRLATISDANFKSSVTYALKALQEKIEDQRVNFLVALHSGVSCKKCNNVYAYEAYDQFIQGNIIEASELAKIGLIEEPDDIYLLFLVSFTKALLSEPPSVKSEIQNLSEQSILADTPHSESITSDSSLSINENIQTALSELFRSGLGNQLALNTIEKLFLNFAGLAWSGVFNLAVNYIDSEQIDQKQTIGHLLKSGHIHPLLVKATENHPLFHPCLTSSLAHNDSIGVKFTMNSSTQDLSNLVGTKLFDEEVYLHQGKKAFAQKDLELAIDFANKLTTSSHSFYRIQGIQLTTASLLLSNRICDVCCYIAQHYVIDNSIATIFPLEELAKILAPQTAEWRSVNHTMALSIVLDAIIKQSISIEESYRAFACEDYLTKNGFLKPSEVPFDESSEMIYYFRYLCIESIMDISTEYDTPDEVEKERMLILKKLVEIDETNRFEYQLEIKKIIRKQVIRQKMLEMEQNKIYVDLEKFRAWATKEIKESFLRYRVYLKSGLDVSSQQQSVEAKTKNYENDIVGLINMVVPINEPFSLLKSILVQILEAYRSSSEFGLDKYLSTRLRHGAIENQLRKFMSQNHLITKKESKDGIYKRNFHWIGILGEDLYQSRDLDPIFRRFSERYDKFIDMIKNEWIVINRGNNDRALFMPPLRDGEVALLQSKISVDTSFTQFMEIVISYMEERLTGTLELVKEKLNDVAKPDVIKMLNNLQQQVAKGGDISELDNAIHTCRTQVQSVFERISDWFNPAASFENTEFPLEDAITVAEAIVQDTTPEFSVRFNIEKREEPVKVNKLPIFFDIMTNAFENVVKRAGLDIPMVDLNISVIDNGDEEMLYFNFTNELGPDVDLDALNSLIIEKKLKIKENSYHSEIIKENGSGLYKIAQSLKDLNQSPNYMVTIDFGLDGRSYFLNLTFPPTKKNNDNLTLINLTDANPYS
ncbi:hypothetical protein HH214_09835 [Mucilaginibacter robiniae]|uniref:Uncharacterized protein n=1 Tax=Mucilaginibacter robiniae TaxID=2728022 RepID=A0A7L5DYH7_9SPHI|nr:hypothetical protein [Mucilaginibacter robiniae]QJD96150.1 hypothetical protein HH214_09835 [Mucilaginibacter robiniae]